VFDHPDRSQRGRTITHAHFFDLGDRELPDVQAGDDAGAVRWVPVAELPSLEDRFHDDHFHMLDHFLGLTDAQ
jgi:bifunctional NMN adenylyltransferase/nudix hydrolase